MTTLVLDLDSETKRFTRDDGPCVVHAGETVRLVFKGLPPDALVGGLVPDVESDSDSDALYPPLRVRLVHPVYGDLAAYPWPGTPAAWTGDAAAGTARCDLSLDTEQLFSVVRAGRAGGIRLYVERPWPQTSPTVFGTYELIVEDWPEATGEVRALPAGLRYASALEALDALGELGAEATLGDAIQYVNAVVAALKNYRRGDA